MAHSAEQSLPAGTAVVRELLVDSASAGIPLQSEHVLDLLPAGVFACDQAGRFTFFNRRAAELWGRAPKIFAASEEFFSGESSADATELTAIASALGENRSMRGLERTHVSFSGERVTIELSIDPVCDAAGRVTGVIGLFHDVTVRKRDERHAQFLARFGEQLVPLSDEDAIIAVSTEELGRHLEADRCMALEIDEQGPDFRVLHHWYRDSAVDAPCSLQAMEFARTELWTAVEQGPVMIADVTLHTLTRDQLAQFERWQIRSIAFVSCARFKSRTVVLGVSGAQPRSWRADESRLLAQVAHRLQPQLARARAERETVDSLRRLTFAMKAGRLGDWIWDPLSNTVTLAGAPAEIIGVPSGTCFERVALRSYLHPDDVAPAGAIVARALADRTDFVLEYRLRRPDGSYAWVAVNGAGVYSAKGELISVIGVMQEITERKRTEVALRESEERLQMASRTGKIGLWDWDVATNRVVWTDSLYEIHGVAPRDFAGTVDAFTALIHPDDRAPVQRAIQSALEHDARYELEFRAVRPGGTIIWVFTNATVVRSAGRAVRMVGATLDVTARKIAELALRESETRFRTLASHAPVGIFLTDTNGDCLFVNDAWRALAGLSPEQARGAGWRRALHPDDRNRIESEWDASVKERRPFAAEYRFVRPDGGIVWLQGGAVASRVASGATTGYIGTVIDITHRRAMEETIRQSERRFRTLTSLAPVGIFLTDAKGETTFVNEAWIGMVGIPANQGQGRGWAEAIHPEDKERVIRQWEAALTTREPVTTEYRFRLPDGTITWVHGHAVPLQDAEGVNSGYIGTIANITQRKLAEERLRAQEAQLRLISTNAPIILAHCDSECRYLFVNREYGERFDLDPERIIGRTIPEVLGADAYRTLEPFIARVLAGERIDFEVEVPYRDVGRRVMRVAYVPDFDASGKVRGWLSAISDITEQQRMAHALRERTGTLEALYRLGTTLSAQHDVEHIVRSVTEAARIVSGAEIAAFFVLEKHEANEVLRLAAHVSSPAIKRETITPPPVELLRHPSFTEDGLMRAPNLGGERGRTSCDGPIPFEPAVARSYLAVRIVSRDGGIIGGLFLGHPRPDVFSEQVERTLLAIAGQAAIAVDNANLYKALSRELEEKKKAEAALRHAQAELLEHAQALETKVAERTASLREAIAQMEEFSYSVSHDLRAPLRAMHAYAQALADDYSDRLDATAKGYLDRIQRSSRRMENLTHDILTYSRVARAEIQLTEVDVETLLRDLLGQYVELQPNVADVEIVTPLCRVRAHESSLGQVVANLLTNAAKFVAPGVRPRIRVRSECIGDHVRIWIEDNGIGISSAHQGGLFQVFERAPTPHAYEGTGIGLAIVRKAVEKMSGQCGVESDCQTGSRFWIELKKA